MGELAVKCSLILIFLLMQLTVVPVAAGTAVVVTIKPVHSLVAGVMRGIAEPKLLVRGSSSPHAYALTPSDTAALYNAALFFRVSPQLEPFTPKLLRALPDEVQVVSVMDAPGLQLLTMRRGPTFEHDSAYTAHVGAPDVIDGHAWLDPENAKAMVDYIAQILSGWNPTHAKAFKSNAHDLSQQLEALRRELEQTLKPVADRPYVVFHDAMHYFERRFGLNAVGSISVNPEIPPSAARLIELRRKVIAVGAQCAFSEPQFSMALVSAVAEGAGVRVGTLDPEAINLSPGPDLYFTLLRTLAADLTRCLTMPA
jgi:zinc transport system substrate-binding protein